MAKQPIFYVTVKYEDYTLQGHLAFRGVDYQKIIKSVSYESLLAAKKIPVGHYIFTDLDRLNPFKVSFSSNLRSKLYNSDSTLTLLNRPGIGLCRYELLRTLYERGINPFNVYRLDCDYSSLRYPVFVRRNSKHCGNATHLLKNESILRMALGKVKLVTDNYQDMIIIEFDDTSDDSGLFRKYSVLKIGDNIIPRHMFFSRYWMLKYPDLVEKQMLEEELEFVKTNPQKDEIIKIFDLAKIDYGRIDYSYKDGQIRVWEINTNPMLTSNRDGGGPAREPVHRQFSEKLHHAWDEIHCKPFDEGFIRPRITDRLKYRLASYLQSVAEKYI